MTGEGDAKARESEDSLRVRSGVCGERLGVEAQLEAGEGALVELQLSDVVVRLRGAVARRAETEVDAVADAGAGANTALNESLSKDTFRPLLFLPSIMCKPV